MTNLRRDFLVWIMILGQYIGNIIEFLFQKTIRIIVIIREVDRPAKYELICKRHIEDSGVTISHATQVKDYSEAASILLQLGFVMQAEISRRRQALEIDKYTMVYIDQIDNQEENFVKIEITLEDDEKVGEAQRKLESLLAEFGLTGNIRLKETYAELV